MKRKKLMAAMLACSLAAGSFATIGSVQVMAEEENLPVDENGDPSPFGKYEETVTVEIVQSINPTIPLPEGDSTTDNYYTRYILENENIEIKVKWQASTADYDQKLGLAIAANDLPDIMVVGEQEFRQLVKSDQLEDLTPYYETYASDIIKEGIDSTGGKAMEAATYDGKMYGLPGVLVEADGYSLMWIRQDWLDELGLEAPTTIEEVETVAKAFVDNEMGGENTIGILGPTVNGRIYNDFTSSNNLCTLEPLFEAFQSFPGFWVTDEAGNVQYGSTTEETRAALAELQKMYADGILDQELGVRKDADEAWKSGKAGILFSPWWHGYNVAEAVANDPEAEWKAYAAPLAEDGNWYPKLSFPTSNYVVVRKGYEHPEVAFILNNYLRRDEGLFNSETDLDIGYYPGRVVIAAMDENDVSVEALRNYLAGEEVAEYDPINYKLLDNDLATVKDILTEPYDDYSIENWDSAHPNFGRIYSLLMGSTAVADAAEEGIINKVYSATYSMTPTMEKRWTNLKKKEDETFLKIIIGEEPIEAFDTFVEEWKAEGGADIIAEVQELLQ